MRSDRRRSSRSLHVKISSGPFRVTSTHRRELSKAHSTGRYIKRQLRLSLILSILNIARIVRPCVTFFSEPSLPLPVVYVRRRRLEEKNRYLRFFHLWTSYNVCVGSRKMSPTTVGTCCFVGPLTLSLISNRMCPSLGSQFLESSSLFVYWNPPNRWISFASHFWLLRQVGSGFRRLCELFFLWAITKSVIRRVQYTSWINFV